MLKRRAFVLKQLTSPQAAETEEKERKAIKRERQDNEEDLPALKSIKGENGKRIYLLDSDNEDEGAAADDKENATDNGDIEETDPWATAEVVDLL